jgi:cyanate lyase
MAGRSLTQSPVMARADVTAEVLAAKRRAGVSWTEIAERATADRVWMTSALLGQHPVPPDLARRLGDTLDTDDAVTGLQEIPTRGSFEPLPPDPTIWDHAYTR